jgi:hypothetical protein
MFAVTVRRATTLVACVATIPVAGLAAQGAPRAAAPKAASGTTTPKEPLADSAAAILALRHLTMVVVPQRQQPAAVQAQDTRACVARAEQETGLSVAALTGADPKAAGAQAAADAKAATRGSTTRGAAKGAALGGAVGAVSGNTKKGAAYGGIVGAVSGSGAKGEAQRQAAAQGRSEATRQASRDASFFAKSLGACLEPRGYVLR